MLDGDTLKWIGSTAISLFVAIFAWVRTSRRDEAARFTEITRRLDDHDRSLALVSQEIDGMPGRDEVHRLDLQLSELSGQLQTTNANLTGQRELMGRLETVVSRLEDHMRGNG
ncbi:MAG: DUF2730 family protein [Pseudomonadota bacterium]